MLLFQLKTRIHSVETFAQFADEFGLNEQDLVLTNDFLYQPYMAKCGLKCHFVMQEHYGTGEPSDEMMNAILKDVKGVPYKRVIAIGGGTVIDIAKLFVLRNITDVLDAFDRKMPLEKDKYFIAIPTTCGTGSEVTNVSIAEIKCRHTKLGLADDTIVPDDAIIIPELLHGLPFRFYAAASIDALIHAMESYLSPRSNPYSKIFSVAAIQSILPVFKEIAQSTPEIRHQYAKEMLIAANMAGIAFGNVGVGAVHALSYPLGGNYHVPHGESNYQFLTEVFKLYHHKEPKGAIRQLEGLLAEQLKCEVEEVYDALDQLLGQLIERKPLKEYGMKPEEQHEFAVAVLETQQRLLKNNYVALSLEEVEGVYNRLY